MFNCNYPGKEFDTLYDKFPQNITTTSSYKGEEILEGKLVAGTYKDYNTVQATYSIDNFLVIFHLYWDKLSGKFLVSNGTEIYYKLKFILSQESKDLFENNENLIKWRQEEIKKEEEEGKDIINTTYFSVIMNCEFYQEDKTLTQKDIYNRYREISPKPFNPEEDLAHIATYHIEPHKVDYLTSNFEPNPVVYPVFIPKNPPKKAPRPPRRRDDI